MKILCTTLLFLSLACWANAFNITQILNADPEYSQFNQYLSQTKLADEINSRQTITVLVVRNGNMGSLNGMPLTEIKKVLSLQVVLDFFDPQKLHAISNGTTLTTTLYQTTGNAPGNTGFVNITDLEGGKVGFGTSKGSSLDSTYVKSVKQDGYDISVIEISQPISTAVAEAPAPTPTDVNITAILIKEGCKIFAGLLSTTGALKDYEDAVVGGLTVFAPTDAAFSSGLMKKLDNFTSDNKVSLLLFHALPSYSPIGTLKTTNGPMGTMATSNGNKYAMTVSTSGDSVVLSTGVNKATVSGTGVDDQPLVIFTISNVLEPTELFSDAPAPAPEADSPVADSPAGKPSAKSHGPSGSSNADSSFAVASYVISAWASILSVVAFGALIVF